MPVDFIPDDPQDDFARNVKVGLNQRDLGVAEQLYLSPQEREQVRVQETDLAEGNVPRIAAEIKRVEALLATESNPKTRAALEAGLKDLRTDLARGGMPGPGTTVPATPAALVARAADFKPDFKPDFEEGMPGDAPATLAERQKARAALEGQASDLEKKIAAAERSVPLREGAAQDAALANIDALKKELAALNAEIDRTGVGTTGRTVGGILGGIAGAIGGGAAGSAVAPGPGTAAGGIAGSAAGTGLGSYLGSKYDLYAAGRHAVSVTPDEASQFVKDNVIDDIIWDGVGNAVLFGGGKAVKLMVNPEARAALRKVVFEAAGKKRAASTIPAHDAAVDELFDANSLKTGTQLQQNVEEARARSEAVPALIKKSGGALPSEGQITGKASFLESVSRGVAPKGYLDAEGALQRGAQEMKSEFLEPAGQMSRPGMGSAVADAADKTVANVKARTGPVFERMRNAGVGVDMEPAVARLKHYIDEYDRGGSALSSGEVAKLRESLRLLEGQRVPDQSGGVIMWAGDAQGFISNKKQMLRELIDGNEPSTYFQLALNEITGDADKSFLSAISNSKVDPGLKRDLLLARNDYRKMNETMFSDDLRRALRKKPEDVGEFFYSKGTVTELKNLDKALDLAIKEKAMTDVEATALREGMTRDFIGRMAADPSKWTETLRNDKRIRDTFNALTSRPGMADLTRGMRVIEEAAKIAERRNAEMAVGGTIGNIPSRSVIGLAFGFLSATVGTVLLGTTGIAKVMATAATRGDKGIVRNVQMMMQAYKAGDKAIANPAIRTAVEDVIKYASDNGIDLVTKPQPTQEQ